MEIRNGKLYDSHWDRSPIHLEFGNREQITIVNRAIKHVFDLENTELIIRTDEISKNKIEAETRFDCICGRHIDISEIYFTTCDESAIEGLIEHLNDTNISCFHCKQEYSISIENNAYTTKYATNYAQAFINPIYK